MKHSIISTAQKYGLSLVPCLLLASEPCSAQFVEVSFQIEATSWPRNPTGERTEQRRTYDAHCIFGTNIWMIEGEFARNAKQTWWCTGTNLVQHTVITSELPESQKGRNASFTGDVPHAGERFTRIYDPAAKRPLGGIAQIGWMAFCSGSFLKSEGRRIQIPFLTQVNEADCSDRTQLFNDELGLPQRVDVYRHDKDLVFTYAVTQSTNFAGWVIPVRFDFAQYDYSREKPFWRGSATVNSIRKATQPLVPPEVMEQMRRKRDE